MGIERIPEPVLKKKLNVNSEAGSSGSDYYRKSELPAFFMLADVRITGDFLEKLQNNGRQQIEIHKGMLMKILSR